VPAGTVSAQSPSGNIMGEGKPGDVAVIETSTRLHPRGEDQGQRRYQSQPADRTVTAVTIRQPTARRTSRR
jgi:hypothetical protein